MDMFLPHGTRVLHRIRRRIWRRKKKIWNWRRKEDEETHRGRRRTIPTRIERTRRTQTQKKKKKEPAKEEPRKIEKNNRPSEEKEEHEEERKSSFKYSIFTWIFFHIRLPSHSTWVLKTQVPPLNSSFRNLRC